MATHSSTLAWRIPGTGEPGGLPSMGSHRVGHDWSDLAAAAVWTPDWPVLGHPQSSGQVWSQPHKKEALGWGRQNRSPLQHPKCLSSIVLGHSDFLQPCITILPWDSRDVSFEFIVQYALDKFSLWRTQQRDWFLRGVELKRGQEGSRTHTDGLSLPALWPPHLVLKGSFVHLLGEEQRMKLESSIPCWLFPHDSKME